MTKGKGVVAAGHPATADAAAEMLADGGNAFDAALAALCASAVAEPVLSSLGGGGFMLARKPDGTAPLLYDFFAQTPKAFRDKDETDFFPIMADFGDVQQEFHIGLGAMAMPGAIHGLFKIHQDLGRLPLSRIIEPAQRYSRDGLPLNHLQAHIFQIADAIYSSNPASLEIYGSRKNPGKLLGEGEPLSLPGYADTLDALAREGIRLFTEGEIGQKLVRDCREGGGHLTPDDLKGYRVRLRKPLSLDFGAVRIATNPPPSTGGLLIAFGLELLKGAGLEGEPHGSKKHLTRLGLAMEETRRARLESGLKGLENDNEALGLLKPAFIKDYRDRVLGAPIMSRGTTHISIIDADGAAASMTLSNGEGTAYMIPGTGIQMNNMLGEEDINPHGFYHWPVDRRMSSMMAPTLAEGAGGELMVLGSGGSNRIRTALLQVLTNRFQLGLDLADAISAPRLHVEGDLLSLEPGFEDRVMDDLQAYFPNQNRWQAQSMFFGGVHAVERLGTAGEIHGFGDPRRDGAVRFA